MSEWIEGSELARGATAVVTRGRPGTVVKTLNPGLPAVIAQNEAVATRVAHLAGLPVAELLDAKLDQNQPTLTFEYIDAVPIGHSEVGASPSRVGQILAELHSEIRGVPGIGLGTIEQLFELQVTQAPIPTALREAALDDMRRLCDTSEPRVLCHMDLHSLNVLWGDGPTVIDWSNGVAAPAAADVSRTRMLIDSIRHYLGPAQQEWPAEVLEAYLDATEARDPGLIDDSVAWDRVVAAARLDERPPASERGELLARFAL